MNKIAKFLNKYIVGNVFDKASIIDAYSCDQSILNIKPDLVALPENTADIIKIVKLINRLNESGIKIPITVRGSGTSKNGSSLGKGLVLLTKKLNTIQEVEPRSRLIRVQSGITLGELNKALAIHGLHLPVEANPKSTIGGLIAGHPYDAKMRRYGGIFYFAEQAEIVLSNGEAIQTGRIRDLDFTSNKDATSEMYQKVKETIFANKRTVDSLPTKGIINFSNYKTVVHSYNHTNQSLDLMPILFGSEGTIAIITEVILRCELLPIDKIRVAFDFSSIEDVVDSFSKLRKMNPERMDVYSKNIFLGLVNQGKTYNTITKNLEGEYLGIIELSFRNKFQKQIDLYNFKKLVAQQKNRIIIESPANKADFDEINNLLVSYKNNPSSKERLSLLDNVLIPENKLPLFAQKITEYNSLKDMDLSIFGSFASGAYTIRPLIDLADTNDKRTVLEFLKNYSNIISEVNGLANAMEPEGRVRSLINITSLSLAERKLADDIKRTFDPEGIFNPEIKTETDLLDVIYHIKSNPNQDILS